MIVFHQHHIVQAEAVISTAPCHHGCFFQRTQPRRGFSCIQNLDPRVGGSIDEFAGERGNPGESLEKIQSDAFGF